MVVPPPFLRLLVHHHLSTLSPTNFLFFFLTNSPLPRPSFFYSPPCTKSPSHQNTSPWDALHKHFVFLHYASFKGQHFFLSTSSQLDSFSETWNNAWFVFHWIWLHSSIATSHFNNINIKYPTSPCTAHCISLYLKQIIFPNSCLTIFFMVQPLSLSPIPLQAKDCWKKSDQ